MLTKEQKNQRDSILEVEKEMRIYLRNIDKSTSFTFNDDKLTYSGFFENKLLIIYAIRQGLPYKLFNKIKEITPFTEDDWADYLNLSKKTLQRHSNETNFFFKPIHTEKIIELAEVTNFGKEVFDSKEQFYLWLNTPSFALGSLKPLDLLRDSYGKEMVMEELNRIDEGIFA